MNDWTDGVLRGPEQLDLEVDASVVAAAHREDQRVVVDHVERWLPIKATPVRLETVEEYTLNETSIDKIASGLARLYGERRISIPDLPALREELATVILKGRTRIDHHSGCHDDQAASIALAAHWLMAQAFWGKPSVIGRTDARVKRDTRSRPLGTPRGQANRQDAAAHRLALLVRSQRR